MLSEMLDKKHFLFADSFATWQEAIRASCQPLEADGTVDNTYSQQIIDCINKYGPYIVIAPMIAMPHSQENAEGVHGTAISFMKTQEIVAFDPDDREKDARLFFTIATQNHEQHLKNISALAMMLDNEALIEDLLIAETEKDLRELCRKYHI
ncbi:PTS sugar transporter subunit IIA [Suttonella ornithocola]|uniref:Ascorbate-specific phosphotransferase enzyme IIA component n=1 Tax=Suttonella ornithocola TaxID=279832 RepID=A0A380MLT1_9GAMM|nr:PTS sugar transporter subunit IIA [Suttonella ornithocola]SUO93580.1 Ascorbate-specific phosphotransferase enzyme IIA component [Suttonella ornithocola]